MIKYMPRFQRPGNRCAVARRGVGSSPRTPARRATATHAAMSSCEQALAKAAWVGKAAPAAGGRKTRWLVARRVAGERGDEPVEERAREAAWVPAWVLC